MWITVARKVSRAEQTLNSRTGKMATLAKRPFLFHDLISDYHYPSLESASGACETGIKNLPWDLALSSAFIKYST